MQSTLTLQETDPHDAFVIEPDAVPTARADKASPNPVHDAMSRASDRPPQMISDVFAGASSPTVDTTFRAADVDNIKVPRDRSAALIGFLFALCSAVAVAAWSHYGDAAKQTISNWTLSFILTSPFVLTSSPPTEKPPLADQPGSSPIQAAAADQAPAQQAPVQSVPPAQPSEAAAPVAAASPPDSAQLLQSMARDLATMGQQIEQLNASIEQLKAGQAQMSRDIAKTSQAKTSEAKTSEIRSPEQSLRPRISALPPRPPAALTRKPRPAYPYAQPAAASPLPPPQAAAPPLPPPEPQAQVTAQPDADPVVRPPMPLR
jgi:hypothetical protein